MQKSYKIKLIAAIFALSALFIGLSLVLIATFTAFRSPNVLGLTTFLSSPLDSNGGSEALQFKEITTQDTEILELQDGYEPLLSEKIYLQYSSASGLILGYLLNGEFNKIDTLRGSISELSFYSDESFSYVQTDTEFRKKTLFYRSGSESQVIYVFEPTENPVSFFFSPDEQKFYGTSYTNDSRFNIFEISLAGVRLDLYSAVNVNQQELLSSETEFLYLKKNDSCQSFDLFKKEFAEIVCEEVVTSSIAKVFIESGADLLYTNIITGEVSIVEDFIADGNDKALGIDRDIVLAINLVDEGIELSEYDLLDQKKIVVKEIEIDDTEGIANIIQYKNNLYYSLDSKFYYIDLGKEDAEPLEVLFENKIITGFDFLHSNPIFIKE